MLLIKHWNWKQPDWLTRLGSEAALLKRPLAPPAHALQRVWRQHGRQWVGPHGQRRAKIAWDVSVSVPVPSGVLMQAIVEAMFVDDN